MASIDRRAVLAWLAELDVAGVQAATKVKALAVFRAVWAEAVREGLVGADPTHGVSVPKPPHIMGRALNEQELARLIAVAVDHALRAQLLLGGVVGLRWGEIAALNVADVDHSAGLIYVRASLARGTNGYQVKAPKTRSSDRAVPIPQAMGRLMRQVTVGRSGPVFNTPAGARLNYHSSRRALIRTAETARVPDCTGWHVLRRTAATLALRGGLNLKDVQVLLGHSTPSQTLAAYVAARDMLALAAPLDDLARAALP